MSTFNKITIVFPMAGDGSRFDYEFKPFLKVGDQTFIEHAVEPFYKWKKYIDKICFIFREDQEEKYDVSRYLIDNIDIEKEKIRPVIISQKTDGPLQTVTEGLKGLNAKSVIIHYIIRKNSMFSFF